MRVMLLLLPVVLASAAHAQPEMVFGKLRYAICGVGDRETILRNHINLAHLHCPASGGAYNGLPARTEFDRQMADWKKGADALREAGVHPITYIAPDMWYGDPEKRTLIFDFYDQRWGQYEDFLGPRPADPLAWAQLKPDGTPIPYVYHDQKGFYWCTNQPACRQYVQGVIKMHVQYGSHGVFFDGPCNHGCYCQECQKQFREFLRTQYPDAVRERLLSGAKLDEVKLPTDKSNLPLWAALRRFRCESLARFLHDMRAWGRSLCPDFVLTNNYCMWAGDAGGMVGIGEHPELYAREVDILFDEAAYGGGSVMQDDGTRLSNGFHYDYLVAAAASKPAVCTYLGVKDAPAEAKGNLASLEIAESWASQCGKMQQTFRDQPIVDAFTQAGEFQVRNPELFTPAKPLADVGVWVSLQQSVVGSPTYGLAMPRLLSDAGIACRILTDGDVTAAGLKGLRCLVVPGVAAATEAQLVALREFAKSGGGLVAVGPTGTLDEHALPRAAEAAQPFGAGPETGQTQTEVGKGRLAWLSSREISGLPGYARTAVSPEIGSKVAAAVRWAGREQLLLAQAPPQPCEIRLFSVAPDRWRIYLVNYGVTKAGAVNAMQDMSFALRLPGKMKVVSAKADSTDYATPQNLAVTQQAGEATLKLGTLHIWAVVDVKLK
ncbi:beta-galactosidase [bacterium]|nr:beta-galactosidase [bacterium]